MGPAGKRRPRLSGDLQDGPFPLFPDEITLTPLPQLHETQEHPDQPIYEHVLELIAKLESQGIQPSPDDEEDENEGGWDGLESDDEDGDVEMT